MIKMAVLIAQFGKKMQAQRYAKAFGGKVIVLKAHKEGFGFETWKHYGVITE